MHNLMRLKKTVEVIDTQKISEAGKQKDDWKLSLASQEVEL